MSNKPSTNPRQTPPPQRDGQHPSYIVDGANVAYHRQNFENGKFSYRQIELVVDAILERVEREKALALQQGLYFEQPTVLVLLPYPYAQKVVPNSSRHRRGRKIEYVDVYTYIYI